MTENSRKAWKCLIFVQLCIWLGVVASKPKLFRLRARIGCPTFLIFLQLQCYPVYIKNKTKNNIIFSLSCFSAYRSLQEKKIKRDAPGEIRTYLLYPTSLAPNPLHHSGRYYQTATYITHFISNNLISPVDSAKSTDNTSEIKLAYATPFELQGQKNTTISKVNSPVCPTSILHRRQKGCA